MQNSLSFASVSAAVQWLMGRMDRRQAKVDVRLAVLETVLTQLAAHLIASEAIDREGLVATLDTVADRLEAQADEDGVPPGDRAALVQVAAGVRSHGDIFRRADPTVLTVIPGGRED